MVEHLPNEKPIKVLLIEDSPGDARLVQEMLRDAGPDRFDLERADRLSAGVQRLREGGIDLILLDLGLPDSQCLEAIDRTRAEAPRTPILVLTGREDEELGAQAVRQGAQDYLVKGNIHAGVLSRAIRYGVERGRAEEALRASYRHQAVILGSMLDAVIVTNPDGTIRTVNRATLELLGYAEEELVGRPVGIIFEEEEEEEEEEFFRGTGLVQLVREGMARDIELTLVAKSGERIPVAFNGSVIREEDGRLDAVLGVARDMRERKRAQEALQESEARFRRLIDHNADAVVVVDGEGVLRFANPAAEALFDRTAEELVGEPFGFPVVAGEDTELDLVRRGADPVVAEMRVVETEWGGEPAYLASLHDVTERHRMLKDLELANEELRRLNQVKSEFVATVSHELRTPLTIIKEGISLVVDEIAGKVVEEQRQILGTAQRNVDRLAKLIDSLLNISRIESGGIGLEVSLFSVSGLVEDTVLDFASHAAGRGIELSSELPEELVHTVADADKVRQVLVNLISNGLKFTPAGGSVKVTCKENEREVLVSVQDTGVGIAEKDVSRLFQKFTQFDRQIGPGDRGTGLGLAISRELVNLWGGRIWAESELGKGSKFTFTVPRPVGEPANELIV